MYGRLGFPPNFSTSQIHRNVLDSFTFISVKLIGYFSWNFFLLWIRFLCKYNSSKQWKMCCKTLIKTTNNFVCFSLVREQQEHAHLKVTRRGFESSSLWAGSAGCGFSRLNFSSHHRSKDAQTPEAMQCTRIESVLLASLFPEQNFIRKAQFYVFWFRDCNMKRINLWPLPPVEFTFDSALLNFVFDVMFERDVVCSASS